jgi:hypothetical protein
VFHRFTGFNHPPLGLDLCRFDHGISRKPLAENRRFHSGSHLCCQFASTRCIVCDGSFEALGAQSEKPEKTAECSARQCEIGIRIALGAERLQVIGLFVRDPAAMLLVGVVFGTIVALLAGRAASPMLFGLKAYDTAT